MRRARVDRYRLQQGRLRADEVDRITNVAARGEDVPVYLDSIGKSVEWAARKVASLVRAEAIDLVCWDYLHAFDKEGAHLDERQKLNHIARVMTDTTKTAGVAGLICAQVTPDTKAPIPDMYEIRGSKDVVNSADGVMIGFMPAAKIERDDNGLRVVVAEAGERCVVVAKNKPGPGPAGRTYRMGSDLEHGCFDVVADPNARHYEAFDREIGDL